MFNSLIVPHKEINVQRNHDLTSSVLDVMRMHFQLNNEVVSFSTTSIVKSVVSTILELCKVTKVDVLEFSFAVVVTNQNRYTEKVCKVPIFFVRLDNQSIFIDINSKMFKSWEIFLQQNSLPACKICFPVGGRYNVGRKLNIDFSSSPAAAQSLVKTSMLRSVVGNVVDVVKVAASCLIKIAPICFKIVSDLMPVAERFVGKIFTMRKEILNLGLLFFDFKTKKRPLCDVMICAYGILLELGTMILSEVKSAWVDVKKSLTEAYNELKIMFPKLFDSASPSSQHEFLALTERVDSETIRIENEAKEKISAATKFASGSICFDHDTTYNQQIFNNSITACALQGRLTNSKGNKPFETITLELLNVTKEIANVQQVPKLDDLKNIFESVSFTVFEEYRHNIDTYSQSIKAARDATTGEFDVNAFNKSLKIRGDPEDHFMQVALQSCLKSLRCIFKVKVKTEELKKHSKIVLIPLWKKDNDDDVDGLYRCIGVRGTGKFSSQALFSALQENFGNLTEITKSSSIDCMTTIYSNEFTALVSQQINEENTSEGLVFFERCIQK